MIDWKIILNTAESIQKENWYFPNFEVQNYLIPMLNVGFPIIDEYGDTIFSTDDIKRLIGNIDYLLNSGFVINRTAINYDCFNEGMILIKNEDVIRCLESLKDAAKISLAKNGILKFFGD